MTNLRSISITAVTLISAAFGIVGSAQACGDWGHSNSRAQYTGGPTVYSYYSGERSRREYRSNNRSGYVQIGSGRGDYGPRGGWRDRAFTPKR
jgi:hypothetical protein